MQLHYIFILHSTSYDTDLKHLKTQTKAELEKLGRKIGIELDKRLTKDKLIKQIRKYSK